MKVTLYSRLKKNRWALGKYIVLKIQVMRTLGLRQIWVEAIYLIAYRPVTISFAVQITCVK